MKYETCRAGLRNTLIPIEAFFPKTTNVKKKSENEKMEKNCVCSVVSDGKSAFQYGSIQ